MAKPEVTPDQAHLDIGIEQPFQAAQGSGREPYRQAMLPRETSDTADVILVLVSYDDGGQVLRSDAQAAHAARRFSQAKSAVEQDTGSVDLDQERVALAAAP